MVGATGCNGPIVQHKPALQRGAVALLRSNPRIEPFESLPMGSWVAAAAVGRRQSAALEGALLHQECIQPGPRCAECCNCVLDASVGAGNGRESSRALAD